MKTRLFICSGLISLLNVATIKRKEGEKGQYDDYLIIYAEDDAPLYLTNKRLGEIAGFNKIYPVSRIYDAVDEKIVDELYFFSHYNVLPKINRRYLNARWHLIEEGLSSYFKYYWFEKDIASCNFLFLHKKMDFVGYEKKKLKPISSDEIKKTAFLFKSNLRKIPFEEKDKVLFFIGQYIFSEKRDEKFVLDLYIGIVKKLLSLSYKVVFKTHPRHPRPFLAKLESSINSEGFFFLDDFLPAELYDYPFISVISVTSGALLTYSHLYNVPAFCDVRSELLDDLFCADRFFGEIVSQYIPDIQKLYALGNVEGMSRDECSEKLWAIFSSFIESKPILSENKTLVWQAKAMIHDVRRQSGRDENYNLDNFHLEQLYNELRSEFDTLNNELEAKKKIINLLNEKKRIYLDYWKSSFLSLFLIGKKRRHYKNKKEKLHRKIRDIRNFLKYGYF